LLAAAAALTLVVERLLMLRVVCGGVAEKGVPALVPALPAGAASLECMSG
jgi:hypothetical protein